jgi:hypothetical protein
VGAHDGRGLGDDGQRVAVTDLGDIARRSGTGSSVAVDETRYTRLTY